MFMFSWSLFNLRFNTRFYIKTSVKVVGNLICSHPAVRNIFTYFGLAYKYDSSVYRITAKA